MRTDGDWVIPHYGGRPWLERPPLPFWLTLPVLSALGDHATSYRLTSALVGLGCVLTVGWVASLWFGRGVGLLSGVALATLHLFNHYAAGPEAEIFLCAAVTACIATFAYLEFRLRNGPGADREPWLLGRRPLALLAFFVLLGLTNLVKGLFFGDAFVILPAAVYLLWGERPLSYVRRYVWLPGWLAFAACGAAWAVAAYARHPDVVDLWLSDYRGRLDQGFMREPAYYYAMNLPWALIPWTLPALAALALTWRRALTQGRTPERFLWCWALVPLIFLSIPQGKHRHYLLPAVAPWAILGALGAERLWRLLREAAWLKSPWRVPLAVGVAAEVAIYLFVPAPLCVPALCLCPVLVALAWLALSRPNPWAAGTATFAWVCLVSWAAHAEPRLFEDRYADDRDFLAAALARQEEGGEALLVLDDWGPLDASWSLFYLDGRARLLHNVSFLLDERVAGGPEVLVVARRLRAPALAAYGSSELLFESHHSRGEEAGTEYRLGLYRVRVEAPRHAGPPAYVSPMQATGRAPGPWLRPTDVRAQSPPPSSSSAPTGGLAGASGR
jgi:hypothetical protein